VLSWLLGEPRGDDTRTSLAAADLVLASSLTLIECDRVLIRATVLGLLDEAAAGERRARLARAAEHRVLFDLDAAIAERARQPFPHEPLRTLDALHLATATVARSLVPDLVLLSLDARVREAGRLLDFALLPD
jgi:predicted nucleic acid-binding protein